MSPVLRFAAALMLAFLVPVQAGAAACAQICAQAMVEHQNAPTLAQDEPGHAHANAQDGSSDDLMHGHHCDKSDSPGKCCQGHTVMTQRTMPAVMIPVPALERERFVARWTNFLPEEPSPPPIRSARA